MEGNKEISIESQYQLYLEKMKLQEENMHHQQRIQLRQAFMGGAGQTLLLMRDVVGAMKDERKAIVAFELMLGEVLAFWNGQ